MVIFDHRGIGESSDDDSSMPSTALYAQDAAALLDYLGYTRVHVVGLVGLGACIAQELAFARPDLVRSLVNMGAWAAVDSFFRDQLELLRFLHGEVDFYAFQRAVTLLSFDPTYYNENQQRLLGQHGDRCARDRRPRAETAVLRPPAVIPRGAMRSSDRSGPLLEVRPESGPS